MPREVPTKGMPPMASVPTGAKALMTPRPCEATRPAEAHPLAKHFLDAFLVAVDLDAVARLGLDNPYFVNNFVCHDVCCSLHFISDIAYSMQSTFEEIMNFVQRCKELAANRVL
jgi:hypothetical protein